MTNEELRAKVQAIASAANRLSQEVTQLLVYVETTQPAVEDKPAKVATPKAAPAKTLKLEDVRAVLTTLSSTKGASAVKALLKDYGAEKLSDIAAQDYPELLAKAQEMSQ